MQPKTEDGSVNEKPRNVTIHVRDESKEGKRDFVCDRDLLVSEMGYFRDFLIKDGQFVEEVEIIVHCDIKVFEWLMCYVKRRVNPQNFEDCHISVSNILAILISSNFLKMESLTETCVRFFCENINAIIASPCSLNCIDDELMQRIIQHLTVREIDSVKDKKDKIKSKLFFKKIEQLFERDYTSFECPENAATIFQCAHCDRILTKTTACTVPCLPWRRLVSMSGDLIPIHKPLPTAATLSVKKLLPLRRSSSCTLLDAPNSPSHTDIASQEERGTRKCRTMSRTPTVLSPNLPVRVQSGSSCSLSAATASEDQRIFCVTELLAGWFRELKSWRLVYWRLWATINLQSCIRCRRQFPIIEFGDGCFFHPEDPIPVAANDLFDERESRKKSQAKPNSFGLSTCLKSPRHPSMPTRHQERTNYRSAGEYYDQIPASPNMVYPCCGLRVYRFEPFEIQSGCYRNEHILDERDKELEAVTRLTVQHRDLFISWAPKRSFNPKNAPGLMAVGGHELPVPGADQVRWQFELFTTTPAFLLLACLDRSEDIRKDQLGVTEVGNQVILPTVEIPGGQMQMTSAHLEEHGRKTLITPANGLLSSTLPESGWDSMKCCRSNQDSQRQGDLRRMHKLAEFLYSQRKAVGSCEDKVIPKEFAGGIYSRLEAQWRAQAGVHSTPKAGQTLPRKTKASVQYVPFR
ncbi:hypothetical protein CSKR_102680 [Clonorchis sinensis]|uniref:SANT and BTB domain-containing protein n=1 Tax=Clonorchis sinensis TaxID=79923 RepID=A0A8T1MQW1_CLOSI|nr:hypothetical protein CSKR_102680 [Clonorchis sinensis]